MADMTAKAPNEPQKIGAYLHDRTRLPASPRVGYGELLRRYWGLPLGIVLAAGFVALAFEIRAGWENHREWVVAMTTPLLAIAGLAYGHLIARGKIVALSGSAFFTFIATICALSSAWVGAISDGYGTTRDLLAIFGGIALGIAVVTALIALVALEWRDPLKPPTPAE